MEIGKGSKLRILPKHANCIILISIHIKWTTFYSRQVTQQHSITIHAEILLQHLIHQPKIVQAQTKWGKWVIQYTRESQKSPHCVLQIGKNCHASVESTPFVSRSFTNTYKSALLLTEPKHLNHSCSPCKSTHQTSLLRWKMGRKEDKQRLHFIYSKQQRI